MDFEELGSTNILNRILFLEGYLQKYSKEDLKSGKGIELDKIDENDLVELSEKFEESDDTSLLEKAVKTISELMDLDSSGQISNEELRKFQDILKELGLTANEILVLYDKFNIKVSSDVDNIDTNKFENITFEDFKELISQYPKLSELAEEVGYKKLFALIDSNSNNTLDADELEDVVSVDGSNGNLSYKDIIQLLRDADIDFDDVEKRIDKDIEDIKTEKELIERLKSALGIDDTKQNDTSAVTPMADNSYVPASSGGYSGGSTGGYSGGSSGGYSSGGSTGGTSGTTQAPAQSNTQKIEELEKQKTEKKGELDTLNGSLSAVLDGSDSEISDKKTAMDDAEKEYKELLEENAENNEEVKQYKEELEGVEKDLETNETNINETETALNDKGREITTKKTEISGLESDKGALERSLEALNAIQVNDKNKSEIESKRTSIEDQLKAKESEITTAKDELDKLEKEEKDLQDKLDDYKQEKEELENKRKEIEDNLEKVVDEKTKEALNTYQEARDAYESAKDTRLEAVKSDITAKETEINEIETQIQELKAAEIEKENQVGPYAMYNAERGQALADAANSLYGNVSKGGGRCATGVSQAIGKAYGYTTHGNGCDYGNVLSGLDDWVEITDQIGSAAELKDLPAGAIVSWSPYNTTSLGRLYGHVYIADGQGHEISDFKGNISTYYADRGSQYRVFIPT